MARLIRAVALMKRTDRYPPYISDTVRKELRYVPTVDAVEVVRCKDCRYYDAENHNCLDELGYARVWEEDDYCSFAERKNDATND